MPLALGGVFNSYGERTEASRRTGKAARAYTRGPKEHEVGSLSYGGGSARPAMVTKARINEELANLRHEEPLL